MKRILPLALLCACSYGAFAVTFPIFDPFVDATASGGTDYSDGSMLKGQVNATGNTWVGINTAQSSLIPLTGYAFSNYAVGSALPTPTGTEVGEVKAGNGQGVRMDILPAISNGTVYASMYIKCTDISALSVNTGSGQLQGGTFHIAFGDTNGTSTANNGSLGGRWYFRKSSTDSTKFNIGVSKVTGVGNVNPVAYWDPTDYTVGDELFVVVGYAFNSLGATNDDTAKLWVNPPAVSLGQTTEPTPTAQGGTSPADRDLNWISCFNIMSRSAAQVTDMLFDEVRIGTNWAQVTSTNNVVITPTVQPKLSASLVNPTTVQLSWGTNSTGFTLQSTSTLLSTNTPWAIVGGSATVSGTNYVQTDTVSGTKFYRLKQ